MSTAVAKANDKYRASLRSTWIYSPADSSLLVNAVPANVPTIVVVGWKTSLETVIRVEGKSGDSASNYALTGVTVLKGAGLTQNLPEQTPVNCLNNEEFFNQYETQINAISEDSEAATAAVEAMNARVDVLESGIVTKKVADDGATITLDLSLGSVFEFVLGGNRALALSNIPTVDATKFKYILIRPFQDATGSRTLTWFEALAVSPITMTIATPGVVTLGKDIPTGTPITFSTTGALPTGVTAGTVYYWIRVNATTGNIATTLANAQAGTKIDTSGTQSGVHSASIKPRWASNTAITLTTGKFRGDEIGLKIIDSVNGVMELCIVNQDI